MSPDPRPLHRSRSFRAVAAAAVAGACLAGPAAARAQQPDTTAPRADSAAAADTWPGGLGAVPAADSSARAVPVGQEAYFMVDTIIVMEDLKGLVWGDWYLNPDVGTQIAQAIERAGQLSGRTWLESSAPIRDLALGKVVGGVQTISFVDKGVALDFWEPDEVDYRFAFAGPWGLTASGVAESGEEGPRPQLVRIPLPITEPPDRASLEARRRAGRLDITYSARSKDGIPRGRFSIYLYYLNPRLGYRIVGVGF